MFIHVHVQCQEINIPEPGNMKMPVRVYVFILDFNAIQLCYCWSVVVDATAYLEFNGSFCYSTMILFFFFLISFLLFLFKTLIIW